MSDGAIFADNEVLANVEFDEEGFMVDAGAWNEQIAEAVAATLGITLTDRHWVGQRRGNADLVGDLRRHLLGPLFGVDEEPFVVDLDRGAGEFLGGHLSGFLSQPATG